MSIDEIDLLNVAIVGELTTEDGPFVDDHFLVLVYRDGRYLEIASGDATAETVRAELEAKTGVSLPLGLCNCTTFKSRVIYPEVLREQPIFTFREERGFRSFLNRIRRFGVADVELELTSEMKAYLAHDDSSMAAMPQ